MQLNFKKTWEMVLKCKSTKALPVPLTLKERKPSLKLLGVAFQSDPCNCDLGVCKSYVFVNSMDYRWIIFIFLSLVLFYIYLHMLWKYGAARIIIST